MNKLHEQAVMTAVAAAAGDVQTMTPEQIDEILFPLWAARWQIATWLRSHRGYVCGSFFPGCKLPGSTYAERPLMSYQLADAVKTIRSYEEDLEAVLAATAPFDDEFERRPWVRYVLCGNHNGHLHFRDCSTLRITTEILLVPQASGLKSSEVVGRFGETACTKCFPGAPVAGVPQLDEDTCPGTKKPPVEGTHTRRGMTSYGECSECHTRQVVTAAYRIRKHAKAKD